MRTEAAECAEVENSIFLVQRYEKHKVYLVMVHLLVLFCLFRVFAGSTGIESIPSSTSGSSGWMFISATFALRVFTVDSSTSASP